MNRDFEKINEAIYLEYQKNLYESYKKFFKEIPLNAGYKEIYMQRTKDELIETARRFGLKPKTSMKKEILADLITDNIEGELYQYIERIDNERKSIIQNILDNNGTFAVEEPPIGIGMNFYFNGIIIPCKIGRKYAYYIPEAIRERIKTIIKSKEIEDKIRKNTENFNILRGYLLYFGIITAREIVGSDLFSLEHMDINQIGLSFMDLAEMDSDIALEKDIYYSLKLAINPEELLSEIEMRSDIAKYKVTKEQLLWAAKRGKIPYTQKQNGFINFLVKKYTFTNEEAEILIDSLITAVNNEEKMGMLVEIVQDYIEVASEEELNRLVNEIVLMSNGSRRWILKGNIPDEVSKEKEKKAQSLPLASNVVDISQIPRKAIGRNDPCPCGSGRKYKHCCGK